MRAQENTEQFNACSYYLSIRYCITAACYSGLLLTFHAALTFQCPALCPVQTLFFAFLGVSVFQMQCRVLFPTPRMHSWYSNVPFLALLPATHNACILIVSIKHYGLNRGPSHKLPAYAIFPDFLSSTLLPCSSYCSDLR